MVPLLLAAAVAAQPVPVLVELFTSEGCSSCPPADALLQRLVRDQPVPGVRVVALSEHVDYWDRLGWRDPASAPLFTQRQQAYAPRVAHGRVYTPQAVVQGELDALGSDDAALASALRAAAGLPRATVQVSRRAPGKLHVRVTGASPEAHLFVARVQDGVTSHVARGENQGRTLSHVAVVRSLRDAGPGPDVDVDVPPDGLRGVVFVQEPAGRVQAVAETE